MVYSDAKAVWMEKIGEKKAPARGAFDCSRVWENLLVLVSGLFVLVPGFSFGRLLPCRILLLF